MTDIPTLAAQTLAQDTHIIRNPSPSEHIAPSTSADTKIHVHHNDSHDIDPGDEDDTRSISSSVVNWQPPRGRKLPLMPDLRFEQSYLASIAPAQGVWWKIALITLKDQCLMPLLQGVGYNLFVAGFRTWNRGAKFAGAGVGARVRRWWWGVNNWELPKGKGKGN